MYENMSKNTLLVTFATDAVDMCVVMTMACCTAQYVCVCQRPAKRPSQRRPSCVIARRRRWNGPWKDSCARARYMYMYDIRQLGVKNCVKICVKTCVKTLVSKIGVTTKCCLAVRICVVYYSTLLASGLLIMTLQVDAEPAKNYSRGGLETHSDDSPPNLRCVMCTARFFWEKYTKTQKQGA